MSYGAVTNCPPNQIPTATGCRTVSTSGGGLLTVAADYWNKIFFGASGGDPLTLLLIGFAGAYFLQTIFGPARRKRHKKFHAATTQRRKRARRKTARPAPSTVPGDVKQELRALIASGAKVTARK